MSIYENRRCGVYGEGALADNKPYPYSSELVIVALLMKNAQVDYTWQPNQDIKNNPHPTRLGFSETSNICVTLGSFCLKNGCIFIVHTANYRWKCKPKYSFRSDYVVPQTSLNAHGWLLLINFSVSTNSSLFYFQNWVIYS